MLIATTARWTYADPNVLAADVLVVDEAWQATYADVGALGAFAPQIVCVGDPGQIDPVVTGQTRRWDGSPTGPQLPAPAALLAAHGEAVSAGFSTTELPVARAGAIFQAPIISGKFQGTIAPTTPTGSRWIRPRTFGAVGATSP